MGCSPAALLTLFRVVSSSSVAPSSRRRRAFLHPNLQWPGSIRQHGVASSIGGTQLLRQEAVEQRRRSAAARWRKEGANVNTMVIHRSLTYNGNTY